jgi:lipopolysaccharide transport system permease protein
MPDASATAPLPEGQVWTKEILPMRGWFHIPWRELWAYRDLIVLFSLRDISASYKQTILGPFWFVIQPLMATVFFSVLFGRMAKMGSDGLPHFLFYFSGFILWQFFSECVNKTSNTFTRNAHIFGKVYFPRLAMPLSSVVTGIVTFVVQFTILLIALGIYLAKGVHLDPNWRVLVTPVLLLMLMMLGLGLGCTISSLSTRYKDLGLGIGFGLQLWMFASSIVFPLSKISEDKQWILQLNPIVPIVEAFRFAYFGTGRVDLSDLAYSGAICAGIFLLGVILFHRAERTVMDTV